MHPQQRRFIHAVLLAGLLFLALALLIPAVSAEWQAGRLREQLTELADQHGFTVKGLDRLGDEPAKPVAGELRKQLAMLLSDYSFLLREDGQGNFREVQILGHRPVRHDNDPTIQGNERPLARRDGEQSYFVNTVRHQSHHYVEAFLTGPNGYPQLSHLLIDTGATTVVLPTSLSKALGFSNQDLRSGWAQTASGKIPVQFGLLAVVKVGDAVAKDVEVSFMADAYLDETRILGMSFLRNFRIFLDDQNGELILFSQ
jgi:aspartyl protease family protein